MSTEVHPFSVCPHDDATSETKSDGSSESGFFLSGKSLRRRRIRSASTVLGKTASKRIGDLSSDGSGATGALPQGKFFHYFLSHKKTHSKVGSVPAEMAQNLHDSLELLGYTGFLDVDNLKEISKEALRSALEGSVAMIVFLNDETALSEWCRYEWQVACELDLPCKVVIDMSLCGSKANLVETMQQAGYEAMTRYQWIEFTNRHRRECVSDLCEFLGDTMLALEDARDSDEEYDGGFEIRNSHSLGILHFGAPSRKERSPLLHPQFMWLLAMGGTPFVMPPGRTGRNVRIWKRLTSGVVLSWLLCLLSIRLGKENVVRASENHVGFGDGKHMRITMEAVLSLALYLSWSLQRIVSSKLFTTILRNMEDRTSQELGHLFFRYSKLSANAIIVLVVLGTPMIWAGFATMLLHRDTWRESPWYSGIFATMMIGTPFVLLANFSLFAALVVVVALSCVGLLSSVDVLHKRIGELGFGRFFQVTDRRLVVKPKSLVRFNEKWCAGLESYRSVQAALAVPFSAFAIYIVVCYSMPLSLIAKGSTFNSGAWEYYMYLTQYLMAFTIALVLQLILVFLPWLCTRTLQRLQRRLRMVVCENIEHQVFLCAVCDVDLRFFFLPGVPATGANALLVLGATLALAALYAVPLAGVDLPAEIEKQWWWRGCDCNGSTSTASVPT